jgi:Protein of unknown function (DUF3040)
MGTALSARSEELTNAMINHDEERRLGEIARSLECDDPEFVARIRALETSTPPRLVTWAARITIAGLILTVIGVLASPPLGAIGVLLAITGLAVRLAAPAFTPTVPLRPDDGPSSTGHHGTRP